MREEKKKIKKNKYYFKKKLNELRKPFMSSPSNYWRNKAGGLSKLEMEEPLLRENKSRFDLFPIRYKEIW